MKHPIERIQQFRRKWDGDMGILASLKNIFSTPQRSTPKGYIPDILNSIFNGDKFDGSFGLTKDYRFVDYYTLRMRSLQLFKENPYARGLIRRLLTNEIHTGLNLECNPVSEILGLNEEEAQIIGDRIEISWQLYAENQNIADFQKMRSLHELAVHARRLAFISGDCLIIMRIDEKTKLPTIQLVDGERIKTPFGMGIKDNIIHGVELNESGKHIAFFVEKEKGGFEKVQAYGEKTGRKQAWLIYGSDTRYSEVRGEPILANMLYMLKELDRYRDAEQRAATVNALLPMYFESTEQTVGVNPFRNNGVTSTKEIQESQTIVQVSQTPGQIMDLPVGKKLMSHNTQRPNVNYAKFEESILNVFAWSLEIPPEMLRLIFTSSYSASRQATNELKVYLRKFFEEFGVSFYQPIYEQFLKMQSLTGKIEMKGFLESTKRADLWEIYSAWTNTEWTGIMRASVDPAKDVKAAAGALKVGIGSYDYWNQLIVGTTFKSSINKRKREEDYIEKLGMSFNLYDSNAEQMNEDEEMEGVDNGESDNN